MICDSVFQSQISPVGPRRREKAKRKCAKCGCSPTDDNVKLFRFPKPSIRNLERCTLWAKFIHPDKEYSSMNFQMRLHDENKMLCEKHFKDNDFTDVESKKMNRLAVPGDNENDEDNPLILNFACQVGFLFK